MSYYNDEKPKNDFEKPKFAPYDPTEINRERGGCLTVFLVFVIAINVFFLFSLCTQASDVSRYSSSSLMPIYAVAFAIQSAVLACAVATWNWKKWGYYGLGAAYGIQMILMLLSGNLLGAVGSLIGLGVLAMVINPRAEMFE
jgi:hypothetical protein